MLAAGSILSFTKTGIIYEIVSLVYLAEPTLYEYVTSGMYNTLKQLPLPTDSTFLYIEEERIFPVVEGQVLLV